MRHFHFELTTFFGQKIVTSTVTNHQVPLFPTSWNLASLGFSLNAPCLSRCALYPMNVYRAVRSARSAVCSIPWINIALHAPSGLCIGIVEWNTWKSVAPQLQTWGIDDVIITVSHQRDGMICRSCSFIYSCKLKVTFSSQRWPLSTWDPLSCPAHGWHASACQISPSYVSPFRRR